MDYEIPMEIIFQNREQPPELAVQNNLGMVVHSRKFHPSLPTVKIYVDCHLFHGFFSLCQFSVSHSSVYPIISRWPDVFDEMLVFQDEIQISFTSGPFVIFT